MTMLPVAEHFISINGEGTKAGELAFFVRFRCCNLCCSYCDTRWACTDDAPAEMMSAEEIASLVRESGIVNVTLTGGEPLLQKELPELVELLISDGRRVEIETNGSIDISPLAKSKSRPSFTLDYKLPSSGMEKHMLTGNYEYLTESDTVKFVSGSITDLERAKSIIDRYSLTEKCHVYISPVFGRIQPAEIVEFMKSARMNNVRLQLQLHKFIWDPMKKGV